MRLSSMRYKSYVWPHNPETFTVEYRRQVAAHKIPMGGCVLQEMGVTYRVLQGEGEFAGADAYREFERLAAVFQDEGPGLLVHPVWRTERAYFVLLSVTEEPRPDYVRYRFVAAHEDWIEKHLEKLRASPALPEPTPAETEALKAAAWAVLPERVAYWSTVMGVRPAGIKITTAKKRYGSCSSKHSLCFSCYLMRSPMEAVDLVVVHELCHIQEMNHGPRFYALLERYLPDLRERKRLLV